MAHLLIVDDEQSICWGLAKLAEELGHTAATAVSAEEGLELARQRRPDAIVLDVRLPGLDGLSAMQRFAELLPPHEGASVPIIIITAYGELATAVEAVHARCSAVAPGRRPACSRAGGRCASRDNLECKIE